MPALALRQRRKPLVAAQAQVAAPDHVPASAHTTSVGPWAVGCRINLATSLPIKISGVGKGRRSSEYGEMGTLARSFTPARLLVCCLVGLMLLAATACSGGTSAPPTASSPSGAQPAAGLPQGATPTSTLPTGASGSSGTGDQPGLSHPKLDEIRKVYPPELCSDVLSGAVYVPAEVDQLLRERIGEARLNELRSGAPATGQEKDLCALCLWELDFSPNTVAFSAARVDSSYRVAASNLSGWFTSGQEADIMLSGIDFNNSGGPLLFNHPKGIATDGTHFLLCDGNNNRVLIWNSLPKGNTPPDVVLGQPSFTTNYPGTGRHQMNWPVSVATDGKRVVVADTYNDRILIWNTFPTRNATPADIVLDGKTGFVPGKPSKQGFSWPWGVWTDGQKLVVSSTMGGYVLIWNSFPTRDNQPADVLLTGGGHMGTPRTITSDGKSLIVGDHNARNTNSPVGNFFWTTFPTKDDQPYDFFRPAQGAWLTGAFTREGKLVALGDNLEVWNSFPRSAEEPPALSVTGYRFAGGDGASVAIAGSTVYLSLYNGNRVVAYNSVPTDAEQKPDFAIGSPNIYTNTLDTHYLITNGCPATDGKSLFVSSDFDRRLYVWKQIPDESGAYPDLVYRFPQEPWDIALWEKTLALAGKDLVVVWKDLPLAGQPPDVIFTGHLGGVSFKQLTGVALDAKYLYLADHEANKVYVCSGIPSPDTPPLFSLDVDGPWRLCSDGTYLVVTSIFNHRVEIYRVAGLSGDSKPIATIGGPRHQNRLVSFNLPQNAIVARGSLFVADTGNHRVFIWKDVSEAIAGKLPDVELGKGGPDVPPWPTKDGFFNPAGLAFDGSYLWVGEFKFSFRLLRFSVR